MYLDQVNYELNKKSMILYVTQMMLLRRRKELIFSIKHGNFYPNQPLNSLSLLRQSPVVFQKIIKN